VRQLRAEGRIRCGVGADLLDHNRARCVAVGLLVDQRLEPQGSGLE